MRGLGRVLGILLSLALPWSGAWPAAAARVTRRPPAAVMAGIVYRPDGRPASDVMLTAVGQLGELLQGRFDVFSTGPALFTIRTDARGRYTVSLDAGHVRGQQTARTWPQIAAPGATSVPAQWDVILISQRGIGYALLKVQVGEGQRAVHQDVHLRRGDRVRGRVVAAATRAGLPGAHVYAMPNFVKVMRPVVLSEAVTDAAGRFRLPADLPSMGLPPGAYLIGAVAPGLALVTPPVPSLAETSARARSLTLAMGDREVRLHGRVVDAKGAPVRGQQLALAVQATGGPATLRGYFSEGTIATDDQGRFTLVRSWPKEEYYPWSLAYPKLRLTATLGDRKSQTVTVDTRRSAQGGIVFRLQ